MVLNFIRGGLEKFLKSQKFKVKILGVPCDNTVPEASFDVESFKNSIVTTSVQVPWPHSLKGSLVKLWKAANDVIFFLNEYLNQATDITL